MSEASQENPGDGRNISADLGLLQGEAARQKVSEKRAGAKGAITFAPPRVPASSEQESLTYYGRPVLKEPVWIWAVPAYFFVGGAAGASAVLGAAAQLSGDEDFRDLCVGCRWVAAMGAAAGGALLIYDLGRPSRFLNMLRVFRPTSAMSMGSWVLAAFGAASAKAALLSRAEGGWAKAGDAAALAAGALGLPLAGYTAVLLADTAVPFWKEVATAMPPLFISSAAVSAASILKLFDLNKPAREVVRRFGIIGAAAELICAFALERRSGRIERVSRPLKGGAPKALWRSAEAMTATSLAFSLLSKRARPATAMASFCGITGGLALRFAIFQAGKQSARDPRATFEQQQTK